jgi:hypothetical protein
MGLELRKVFHAAGLPVPSMHLDMPLSHERDYATEVVAIVQSLRPRIDESDSRLTTLGDVETLAQRLADEIASTNSATPWIAAVSAWTNVPA